MPTNTIERRHDIIQTAADAGRVQVSELVEKYSVSAVTIRGDLNYLHKKGLLVRTHGGAVASNRVTQELSVQEKVTEHLDIKRRLAATAVKEIREQDTIILDSGTTTAEIARQLRDFERLLVMTNGLNVAQQLLDAEGIEVLMTGGTLRKKSLSFYGRPAEEMLRCYHFDKVFLGVDGIDFQGGITTHFEYEANLNRLMCKVARQVIAVTDSSKFNRSGVHKICDFADIDILITDAGIPDTFHQAISEVGVKVVIVD
ncbi:MULTISPECIES: transcriptional repressor AgaR [unclassified Microbulbifer]|uniref:Transcriptional repressor AgaR n=1 Tax=Microbulbifer spongiae TaxID=2944933 RepID=A0ABY9EEJ1_9GAMM|nr:MULTISPECIES: transcriptional repressor AgaR [unclassified Microbulbifer]MDP5210601.1 transcriptional repressor AgaR [Microbulbifer sp. 2205BS26-8]WKD50890.1 transcriptional repressor AgaR [Microbulbifer sp. MI-G]